ncbi:MAG: tyrosine--tRNA ligase [Anaerolineae bacterium]|nr:tyrosine--tRNA ligase [Anaerolineae bacterium]
MTATMDEQLALLMRGTEYGDEQTRKNMERDLRERLQEGRPLRVYCGFDPTKPDLHLGHTIPMRKLRQFQDLGHEVTFLIGNYTTLIGDPSDKNKLRPMMTAEEIEANARTYAEQAFRILDRDKTLIRYNADWLSKLSFADLIGIGSGFTMQQFFGGELLQRFEAGDAIFLHETFYALMQAYDAGQPMNECSGRRRANSWFLSSSRGASCRRPLVRSHKPTASSAEALPGTNERDGPDIGNVAIFDAPNDMYGKVMSIPDEAMWTYFDLVTRLSNAEIASLKQAVRADQHYGGQAARRRITESSTRV